ncbi:SRPBCC family protein [Subsaxibacter sp. CAU 1640]|uniref:SRPBCC family protein n=1 Tax=Subsaxibacter sp. CAU 1640 TaxID=2933271 RepID=UPI0020051B2E|nr:SRPBCC family protein [Subsaxibacter sp. CAU 1640]MCK7591994.1 SRPBCC family protein [Subsaxibacter sp. CAU 1640]
MKLESPKQIIDKSPKQVYDFLNDLKNFEKIMPENMSKFELLGENGFIFALSGMPDVALQKKESSVPNKLILEAAGGKLDFNLFVDIVKETENSSRVQFLFNGDFNAMIAMMVKGPISKLIETWAKNLQKII